MGAARANKVSGCQESLLGLVVKALSELTARRFRGKGGRFQFLGLRQANDCFRADFVRLGDTAGAFPGYWIGGAASR